jgi:CheY-like chemotaxis protein
LLAKKDEKLEDRSHLSSEEDKQELRCLKGKKILVVDDESDTRDYISFVLEESGAIVMTGKSVTEAIEIYQQFQPDILISDIGMPEEDGYSLIQQLRLIETQQGKKQMPAIALTAFARTADRNQAMQVGFSRHVTKPVEPQSLLDAIVSLLTANS